MDLKATGHMHEKWMHLVQNMMLWWVLVNADMNIKVRDGYAP